MDLVNCKGRLLDLTNPIVMGILNITPDSFFDGGQHTEIEAAKTRAALMISEGATIIDVGGMSSRPNAEIIDVKEELIRVIPIIKAISSVFPDIFISIDTVHSKVAKAAINAGASIVNDISGGNIDKDIWKVCVDNNVAYITMHMQGIPENMQNNPHYNDVVLEVLCSLRDKYSEMKKIGLTDVIIDPGFGFGKSIDQNYTLLKRLASFKILECPVLVGVSRKSMIYKPLNLKPSEALNATTGLHMVALQNGAKILRVHDVKQAVECIKINALLS
ncbi:MAG: dihydropteroate synthase [Saprospiraceae bacterium]